MAEVIDDYEKTVAPGSSAIPTNEDYASLFGSNYSYDNNEAVSYSNYDVGTGSSRDVIIGSDAAADVSAVNQSAVIQGFSFEKKDGTGYDYFSSAEDLKNADMSKYDLNKTVVQTNYGHSTYHGNPGGSGSVSYVPDTTGSSSNRVIGSLIEESDAARLGGQGIYGDSTTNPEQAKFYNTNIRTGVGNGFLKDGSGVVEISDWVTSDDEQLAIRNANGDIVTDKAEIANATYLYQESLKDPNKKCDYTIKYEDVNDKNATTFSAVQFNHDSSNPNWAGSKNDTLSWDLTCIDEFVREFSTIKATIDERISNANTFVNTLTDSEMISEVIDPDAVKAMKGILAKGQALTQCVEEAVQYLYAMEEMVRDADAKTTAMLLTTEDKSTLSNMINSDMGGVR